MCMFVLVVLFVIYFLLFSKFQLMNKSAYFDGQTNQISYQKKNEQTQIRFERFFYVTEFRETHAPWVTARE